MCNESRIESNFFSNFNSRNKFLHNCFFADCCHCVGQLLLGKCFLSNHVECVTRAYTFDRAESVFLNHSKWPQSIKNYKLLYSTNYTVQNNRKNRIQNRRGRIKSEFIGDWVDTQGKRKPWPHNGHHFHQLKPSTRPAQLKNNMFVCRKDEQQGGAIK